MPRKRNEQPLKNVIQDLLRIYGLEKGVKKVEVQEAWKTVVGPAIARLTREVKLSGTKLIVKLDSGVVKEEYSYSKTLLIQRINDEVGREAVEEIVIL